MAEKGIFVCNECNEGEIISVRTELGKIIFGCKHECDVDDYIDYLEKKKGIKLIKDTNDLIEKSEPEKLLKEKIRTISDIIRTNQLVLKTQEKYPENYYHVKSIINIGQSIQEEETGFDYDKIDKVIKEQIKDKKEEEKKAIEKLEKEYYAKINKKIKRVKLKGQEKETLYKWLRDDGFKLISKIRFKELIELNLARNHITKATPLNNMLLPHLEYLDLSYNDIVDIKPVANLKCEYLSVILLHHNKIKDLSPFEAFGDDQVDVLDTLRVDHNNLDESSKEFKAIAKKFGNKLVYKNVDLSAFNKKYDVNYTDEENNWDLSSIKDKDKRKQILFDLSNLITFQFQIQYLVLDDNKLENVSILSRIPLYHLRILDLSLNLITNIKFLKKLSKKSENLQKLYLNDNKIRDLSPLIEFSGNFENSINSENSQKSEKEGGPFVFKKLQVLTLKHNPFYEKKKSGNKDNKEDIFESQKGNVRDRPNENDENNDNEKEEKIVIISIKDKETRDIFKIIRGISTDFGENTKVKEDEEEEEKKKKENDEANDLIGGDEDNISNTINEDNDKKSDNMISEN